MPYITKERRDLITVKNVLDNTSIRVNEIKNCGELNYAITILIKEYFDRNKKYQSINDIYGALEGAKLEFQRQIVEPYEDGKINENGGIY